jgi:hypothetical protein
MAERSPEPNPLDSNYPELNAAFYAGRPWEYFRQRLVHLAAVAAKPGETPLTGPFAVGPVTIGMQAPETDRYPTPSQTFVAIESEVLLHHAAETLLRLIYAHAEPHPCPWLRMSAMFRADQFKKWVKRLVRDPKLTEIAAEVFGRSEACPNGPTNEAEWIRVFAWHFLNAGCYNAAKHGMALGGGAEERIVRVEDQEVFRAKGAALSWLAKWPLEGDERPRRWTRASRLFSVEAYLIMVETAAQLMEGVYVNGRALHLDETPEGLEYRPTPPPQVLCEALEIPWHFFVDQYQPLAYEGEESNLIMKFPIRTEPRNREDSDE